MSSGVSGAHSSMLLRRVALKRDPAARTALSICRSGLSSRSLDCVVALIPLPLLALAKVYPDFAGREGPFTFLSFLRDMSRIALDDDPIPSALIEC
jgi:hypothetical protein